MDKNKFRELAQRLGLKTGAELEKIIAFKQAEAEGVLGDELSSSDFSRHENSENQNLQNADNANNLSGENESQNRLKAQYEKQNAYFNLPKNYVNKYVGRVKARPEITVEKGLIVCLNLLKRVDVEYISALCDKPLKQVIVELEGVIFKNPLYDGDKFYEGFLYYREYLSGNVVKKLKTALEKNKVYPGVFDSNVKALRAIVPKKPEFGEFFMGLGSPWIPASYVADFVQYLYRMTLMRDRRVCEVVYEKVINRWCVVLNYDVKNSVVASKTYGTERIDMFKILEKTLNHEQIRITDGVTGNKKGRTLNREQTMLAEEKRSLLKRSFVRWLEELEPKKKQELCDIWHENFSYYSLPLKYQNQLSYEGLNSNIQLYDYQKQAVSRILQSKTTLLAHDVGAGKTYAMIVSAHELFIKRGFKNLIVVPNSILAQWENDYKLLYPNANIYCVYPENFSPDRRENALKEMSSKNYESVLMAYSTFELIEAGSSWQISFYNRKIYEIEYRLRENSKRRTIIRNKFDALLNKKRGLYMDEKFRLERKQKNLPDFDDLGFNTLFLDEAHNYKNLPLESSMGNIKGLNVEGSVKCYDVYLKTRFILSRGGKVVFATGTPITNSVADAFVMQKYLQEDELCACDLDFFDNWAGVFGEITRSYEIDVDTENYRLTTRFNKFNNLNLLSKMLNRFTDFHVVGQDGLPKLESVNTVVVEKTQSQIDLLKQISERAQKVRAGEVDRKSDNLLKITTDGRKLALDPRLILEDDEKQTGKKIFECACNVKQILDKYPEKTQLVFCDIGTPKSSFNAYDELKQNLISLGIDENRIGFVHDATSDKKREKLFESVNNGAISVLIGSTFKLGTGVNVQEKLIALHHMDVPWRPSDMVQREGRILRRGNTNEKVFIYRYVTEGSFDAYSWQLLENKQRFITELLTGTADGVSEQQLDDAVLSYAEVKALAIGNPLLKTRVELVNEIARYKTLMREENRKNESLLQMLKNLPVEIEQKNERLNCLKADVKSLVENSEIVDKTHIAGLISFATSQNEGDVNENIICETNGFLIILPASFSRVRPYLIIQGEGRYTVDLATFGMGAVTKIENFFKTLHQQVGVLEKQIEECEMQYRDALVALQSKNDYSLVIKELTEKLREIDDQIGIS